MNFRFWKKREAKTNFREVKQPLKYALASSLSKAVNINTDLQALSVSAVYASIRILSDATASLPLRFLRRDFATDTFEHYTWGGGQLISYALNCRANARMTSYQLMKGIVMQMLLKGNAYVLPKKNEVGDTEEFILISSGCCVYNEMSNTYTINDTFQGIQGTFTASQILHFKNTPKQHGGFLGVSVVEYAIKTINTYATADDMMLERFASGGIGKYVYRDKETSSGFGEYSDEELKNNGADIESQLVNRHVAVTRGDGELTQLNQSANDMQFIQSEQQLVKEVARYFGVPPTKLFEAGSSNYKSVDEANLALYAEGLKPILANIENEFNAKYFDETNYLNYKFEFDIESLYITDSITEADYITKSIANGTMSVNDARKKKNMKPVEGGDQILVSTNLANINNDKINASNTASESTGKRERDSKGRFKKSVN